jgi:hypothetical protein
VRLPLRVCHQGVRKFLSKGNLSSETIYRCEANRLGALIPPPAEVHLWDDCQCRRSKVAPRKRSKAFANRIPVAPLPHAQGWNRVQDSLEAAHKLCSVRRSIEGITREKRSAKKLGALSHEYRANRGQTLTREGPAAGGHFPYFNYPSVRLRGQKDWEPKKISRFPSC